MELVHISHVQHATAVVWDQIWQECGYATYYHSREWAEIWNVYTSGEIYPDPIRIIFTDGWSALLPCSRNKDTFITSPASTYGGWISQDPLRVEHAELLKDYMNRSFKYTWRLNPYDPLITGAGAARVREDETYMLTLGEGFDTVFNRWSHGHRSAARKAIREGVTIRIASMESEWRAYYQVYQDSLRRWGSRATSHYSWPLFEEMLQRNSSHIKLWIANYLGKIIAGSLVLYSSTHAGAWHGAAQEEYLHVRPAILIKHESIRHACELGYKWFDFNPSGGHKGVIDFKKNFGAQVKSAPVWSSS